jgi:hypothetical protein
MANAKDIIVKPITAQAANAVVKRIHYSGKVVPNSQLHFGVFLNEKLEGAMSFGPSTDKRKTIGVVRETKWNDFIELNRMAFSDVLPRNSESRAMAVAFRLIKKHYSNIEWVLSFSDGTQCGDGTIYRAAGFDLIGIKPNSTILRFPDGECHSSLPITNGGSGADGSALKRALCQKWGIPFFSAASVAPFKKIGAEFLPGYQLKYIYFLNPEARARLTVPVLPFSKISDMGASMYKGEKITRVKKQDSENPSELGGAVPTDTLHSKAIAGA